MMDKENQHPNGGVNGGFTKFAWLRTRWTLLAGVLILGIILILSGNNNSQASFDQSISAARQPKDQSSPQEYQFIGQGKVLAGSTETWVVGGVPILAGDQTQIEGKIHPGDSVSMVGHIAENGNWVAERITPIDDQEAFFSFAGPLESKEKDSWKVAGVTLLIDKQSRLGKSIPLGQLVLATFQVQRDGAWLALQIQTLAALEQARTPTVTPTPTPTSTPTPAPTIQSLPSSDHDSQDGMVIVCHKPNQKKGGQTLVVEGSALGGHLKHGDTLGACR